ncbi:hypothetical protein HBI56_018110 [Parastagonospora nodorum]|uniref:Uncharacterized protein n=1 Tax=Phaeosphaeria nodorum (strain SN15 / ATCC MYA-4574 / FGSC 10173) TaxID=321614 RepID=A0A7U2F4S0_PHANO|nr:hypothetical protein HBH56_081880 [Parastagonospora nodorum]QRC96620.1 hypothetical protein JI435_015220 [Parastagonospora nodorum SN15]KAH3929773.1 hypothetical protein HBH54_119960 [Parastagonospora nodorum]KAH3955876.1 hypothetical protein HBH53_004630 [Parastagonospora nodorum]KAH3982335.1 hypothetical protein HBH52_077500 [Parastagonospora nodorum]
MISAACRSHASINFSRPSRLAWPAATSTTIQGPHACTTQQSHEDVLTRHTTGVTVRGACPCCYCSWSQTWPKAAASKPEGHQSATRLRLTVKSPSCGIHAWILFENLVGLRS